METKIHAGRRVLYKHNSGWKPGELLANSARLTSEGLYFSIMNQEGIMEQDVLYDNLYLDGVQLQDWEQDPSNGVLFEVEEFLQKMEEEELTKNDGTAYVSDGEYRYYPVSTFTKNWIKKQPFRYIVWYV